ncbi:MAG TPA: nucleotidyl transferase AbiEii/AbiGii toxin family protein [Blastocatellia bacterium]
MNDGFKTSMAAPERDRLDLFLAASHRLGTTVRNVEKDFWICWTLDALYHGLPPGGPRLLFKGGTSLSKGHDLIRRFSEDIDITVFRQDLSQAASIDDLEKLSKKKRMARLEAIRRACRDWVQGPLRQNLDAQVREFVSTDGRTELDDGDHDGQTLLVWYPAIAVSEPGYVRPVVRIECGAGSALEPHHEVVVRPYIADDAPKLNISVPAVLTIEPDRTFWDKIVFVHGLRRWHEIRGELRQGGQRVSRHYYDLHCLFRSPAGPSFADNQALGADCARHARMFFDRRDHDLASAKRGAFAIKPNIQMLELPRKDYANTISMIFGAPPSFEEIMASINEIDVYRELCVLILPYISELNFSPRSLAFYTGRATYCAVTPFKNR